MLYACHTLTQIEAELRKQEHEIKEENRKRRQARKMSESEERQTTAGAPSDGRFPSKSPRRHNDSTSSNESQAQRWDRIGWMGCTRSVAETRRRQTALSLKLSLWMLLLSETGRWDDAKVLSSLVRCFRACSTAWRDGVIQSEGRATENWNLLLWFLPYFTIFTTAYFH